MLLEGRLEALIAFQEFMARHVTPSLTTCAVVIVQVHRVVMVASRAVVMVAAEASRVVTIVTISHRLVVVMVAHKVRQC